MVCSAGQPILLATHRPAVHHASSAKYVAFGYTVHCILPKGSQPLLTAEINVAHDFFCHE